MRLVREIVGTNGGQACEHEITLEGMATVRCQVSVQIGVCSGGVREIDGGGPLVTDSRLGIKEWVEKLSCLKSS